MAERFGTALRRHRREAGKTLGDLARLLGVSIVYISDVERGNRRPLSNERILKIAEFLGVKPRYLIKAADRERGFIEYDMAEASELEADVVSGLVGGLARGGVSTSQLQRIQSILRNREVGDGGLDDDD